MRLLFSDIWCCVSECVTALDWDHDCSTVRGQKFGCLKWKKCQSEAANTKCIAKCEAAKIPATILAYEKRDEIRVSMLYVD